MALVIADRVKETSTSTGTGTISVAGAVANFRGLVAGIGTTNQTYYSIVHQTLAEWEVGIGTVTDATPDTLSRTTVLASSNAGALVNFSAGTKDVFVTLPAAKVVLLDTAGNVGIGTTTPAAKLEVWNSYSSGVDSLRFGYNDSNAYWMGIQPYVVAGNNIGYKFRTNNISTTVDAMAITGAGNVGIGTTEPSSLLSFGSSVANNKLALWDNGSTRFGFGIQSNELRIHAGGGSSFITFRGSEAGSELVRITQGGNVGIGMTPTVQFELSGSVGQKASGTTWSNPSDARLKEDVTDFTDGLNVLRKVRPVHYMLNGLAGTPKGQRGISVIAQEMVEVMPYTIETYTAKLRPEDADETALYRFDASAVTFALVNAVKELDARMQAMERTRGTARRQ